MIISRHYCKIDTFSCCILVISRLINDHPCFLFVGQIKNIVQHIRRNCGRSYRYDIHSYYTHISLSRVLLQRALVLFLVFERFQQVAQILGCILGISQGYSLTYIIIDLIVNNTCRSLFVGSISPHTSYILNEPCLSWLSTHLLIRQMQLQSTTNQVCMIF